VADGIGDVKSAACGSGARYNGGKTALDLIPFSLLADGYRVVQSDQEGTEKYAWVLQYLGAWQAGGTVHCLWLAVEALAKAEHVDLPQLWAECAAVFEYGRAKYAAWNWAKGMAWSVPLACAGRHLVFGIMRGEELDAESGLPHRGHFMCNIVMLAQYERTYREGDDRPKEWLS
jgi:hypothetical protein